MKNCSKYGNGNPPFSLYQSEDGKWGLVDKDGTRFPADFTRLDEERFQEDPWSVVTFNPNEGFELLAWFDPCEAWFNFTWDDPRYPAEFDGYLWKKPNKEYQKYESEIRRLMPAESHWLLDCISEVSRIHWFDDEKSAEAMAKLLSERPGLRNAAEYNVSLDPVMRSATAPEDMKIALWHAKVGLDSDVRYYLEESGQM